MEHFSPVLTGFIVLIVIFIFFYFVPIGLWFTAKLSGVSMTLLELFFMRLRKSPVTEIVNGLVMSAKAGVVLERDQLEAHGLAGGDILNVVAGMILAKKAGLNLSFQTAAALDFKGIKISELVVNELNKKE
jgi:uncharacterized protein YqfA (UPF0365 family)